MESFVHSREIPNIRRLREEILRDRSREAKSLPQACKITLDKQLSPWINAENHSADSQRPLWWPKRHWEEAAASWAAAKSEEGRES